MSKQRISLVGSCQNTQKSKCTYKCAYGYAVVKGLSLSRTCDNNGVWSHALPQCSGSMQNWMKRFRVCKGVFVYNLFAK